MFHANAALRYIDGRGLDLALDRTAYESAFKVRPGYLVLHSDFVI